jgi:hypothetical protein
MVDPNQVIRYVEKNTDLADAVRLTSESAVSGRTTTFKGTRSKANGSTQEVTIEVLDTGARGGSIRYAVSVYPDDGDVLYAITTEEVQNSALDDVALGTVASEVAWDAILSSIQEP